MCAGYAVGITPRPGLAAYGDGRVVNADRDPHIRRTTINKSSLINSLTSGVDISRRHEVAVKMKKRNKAGHEIKAFLLAQRAG